jgi:hypothetical protein
MPATHISVHNRMYASIRCEENDSLIGENSLMNLLNQSLALSLKICNHPLPLARQVSYLQMIDFRPQLTPHRRIF